MKLRALIITVVILNMLSIGVASQGESPDKLVGYIFSTSAEGLLVSRVSENGDVDEDALLIEGIILEANVTDTPTDKWITKVQLLDVSPQGTVIGISAYNQAGERAVFTFNVSNNELNQYVLPIQFSSVAPLIEWSPDNKKILLNAWNPTGILDTVTGEIIVLDNFPSYYRSEWFTNDSIIFIAESPCDDCRYRYDLYIESLDGVQQNLSQIDPLDYGARLTTGNLSVTHYGYIDQETRIYYNVEGNTDENDVFDLIYSVDTAGNDIQFQLEPSLLFPSIANVNPRVTIYNIFPTTHGKVYLVADIEDVVVDNGQLYIQSIISLDETGMVEVVQQQNHSVFSSIFSTYQASISPDGDKIAVVGHNSVQGLRSLVVVDLNTKQEIFSETTESVFCNLSWSDGVLFYGLYDGCLSHRPYSQPVDALYRVDLQTGVSSLVANSQEGVFFLPLSEKMR